MKVLVVDDEQPALERLASMVEVIEGFEVCALATNGVEALEHCQAERPEIVLLDIRMPGMDGMEAAKYFLRLRPAPAVIFVTAYSDHALEAFALHAMGYLVKPVRQQELEQALISASRPNLAQLEGLRAEQVPSQAHTHICATERGALRLIPIEEVYYCQAEQKYVTVRYKGGEVLIEDSLKTLEANFPGMFIRIHRNALVAIAYLAGLKRGNDGRLRVQIKDIVEQLEVSRRHAPEVRRLVRGL